jgi:hypothetical protein
MDYGFGLVGRDDRSRCAKFSRKPTTKKLRLSIPFIEKAIIEDLSLSPDGRYLAIAASVDGRSSLWVRPFDTAEVRLLPGTDDARFPFWSPESNYIGFFAQRKLRKVGATGGPVETLCDAENGRGGTWNRDGVILFSPNSGVPIYRTSAIGGTPTPVAASLLSGGQQYHRYPAFLPDGRQFIFSVQNGKEPGIYLGALDSPASTRLTADRTNAAYVPGVRRGSGYRFMSVTVH